MSCAFAGLVLLAVGGIAATIEMRKYELRAAQAGKSSRLALEIQWNLLDETIFQIAAKFAIRV